MPKKNSKEQRCVRYLATRLQYRIGFSNDQKSFSCSIYVIFILGTTLLVCEPKSPRWEVEGQGQLVEAFTRSSSILAHLLGFCAALSKKVITLCLEVQMMCRWMRWKLDLMVFPSMYRMHHETLEDGTILNEKLYQYPVLGRLLTFRAVYTNMIITPWCNIQMM